ncbi:hypothetical protein [Subtercola endophyticus]|uniref:hypothetical protein n=1 Tax=Subtercola endophyticus TaxID=2895559 RepID=UPI001E616E3C|nr:hypothetical protein [Subtercola endophyticus]UFS59180.1 hypothetical protein LQ955_19760 [Subtercola endophyticus]
MSSDNSEPESGSAGAHSDATDGTAKTKRGITRREVMTASAWAAPVAALAMASN